jgi:hypothetical protein
MSEVGVEVPASINRKTQEWFFAAGIVSFISSGMLAASGIASISQPLDPPIKQWTPDTSWGVSNISAVSLIGIFIIAALVYDISKCYKKQEQDEAQLLVSRDNSAQMQNP